jgi:hypothetical protein
MTLHRRNGRVLAVLLSLVALVLPSPALASQVLSATMTGGQEVPENTSAATGSCSATVDSASGLVTFTGTFSGLHAPATAAAVHAPAGPGGIASIVLAQTSITAAISGTFSGNGTLSPLVIAGVLAGEAYCEVDSTAYPDGEIRGQLATPAMTPAIPPAGVMALATAMGCAAIGEVKRRARRRSPRSMGHTHSQEGGR